MDKKDDKWREIGPGKGQHLRAHDNDPASGSVVNDAPGAYAAAGVPRCEGFEPAVIPCKSVAKLLLSDELAAQTWWKRAEVRPRLLMCKYCSRLARQIRQIGRAARRLSAEPAQPDPELGERIIRKLAGRN